MDEQRWIEVRRLFESALEQPPEHREAYLNEAGSGDEALIGTVRGLLGADDSDHPFLDAGAPSLDFLESLEELEAAPPPGTGPYRLLDEVGRGGMGVVYRAERADGAFERAVALKLVRGGFDSDEALARFQVERRVLAGLEHPNVARLYDAGVADDGRPYLVMEFVQGLPIDRYCDAERLGVRARIELFRQVCDAVQHAHRSLVIHRDLKPSNILVSDDGSAKLLDFGIAKLSTGDPASSPTTRTGMRLFTPEYASPEQIRGESLTTTSDVFSLGAVLYELLTGRRPFEDWARAAAYALGPDGGSAPPLPSRTVTRPLERRAPDGTFECATPRELALRRAATPDRWHRALRGDLDRILLKALARAPTDRYSSAEALSADLGRYLHGLPVSARPGSLAYRLRKFARRNRVGVAAAAAILLTATVGATAAAREARVASAEREVALGVSSFLEDLFRASDPRVLHVEDTTRMIDFLDAMGDRVRTELEGQPRTRARMLLVLGLTYTNIGRTDRAEPLLREAIEANRDIYGERHEDLAEARRLLGLVLSGQDRFDEAIPLIESALATQRGLTGERSWEVGRLHEALGQVFLSAGQPDRAVPHVEASLAVRREVLQPDDPVIASSLNTLAALKARQGNDVEAIELYLEAIHSSLGNPEAVPEDIGVQRMNLANAYMRTGRFRDALDQARQGHGVLEKNNRPRVVASSRARLAEAIVNVWRETNEEALAEEADSLFRSGIQLMRTLPEADRVRYLLFPYAKFAQSRGDLAAAELAAREVLALEIAATGADHPQTQAVRASLAAILLDAERAVEAESIAANAHAALEGVLPRGHPTSLAVTASLGRALTAVGRPDEAASLLLAARDTAVVSLGERNPLTLALTRALAEAYEALGRTEDARALTGSAPRP